MVCYFVEKISKEKGKEEKKYKNVKRAFHHQIDGSRTASEGWCVCAHVNIAVSLSTSRDSESDAMRTARK